MTQEERNAATPPRPACVVCGTSEDASNVVPCHWCNKNVCINCYYNRDHDHSNSQEQH